MRLQLISSILSLSFVVPLCAVATPQLAQSLRVETPIRAPESDQTITSRANFEAPPTASEPLALGDFAGQWKGKLSGNDPNVNVVLDLKCTGAMLSGTLQWISDTSGTNTRALSGSYLPKTGAVMLNDDQVTDSAPEGGWRFCAIDKYELHAVGDGKELIGCYWSAACRDHGSILVRKVANQRTAGGGDQSIGAVGGGDRSIGAVGSVVK